MCGGLPFLHTLIKMTFWKCPNCLREHEAKDNCKICICKGCLNSMVEVRYDTKQKINKGDDGKQD